MKRSEIKNIYRLSPMQMNMYQSYIQDPESDIYHQYVSNTISYPFDLKHFADSFERLVQKHDALRTVFHTVEDNVVQIVLNHRKPSYLSVDLSEESDKTALLKAYIQQEREKRFNLSKDNLIRLTILKLDEQMYQLIWCFHHIILDGWSFTMLVEDLFHIYFNFADKREEPLPFSKYIQWVNGQAPNVAKLYWNEYLSNYEQTNSLSIPKHQTVPDEYLSKQQKIQLSVEETTKISDYCKSKGISMNAFVTAAWGLLLCQYNNQNDVVFGTVVSGRPSALHRSNEIIGLMINTIPVRITFNEQDSFDLIVSKTQLNLFEAEPYSYYDLAAIQAENHLTLDHVLVFENFPKINKEKIIGNSIEVIDTEIREKIKYPFCLQVIPGESLSFVMLYNALLYRNDIIERLSKHLLQLLRSIITDPSRPAKDITMITPEETKLVMNDFNNTEMSLPKGQTIYSYFVSHAMQNKEKIALRFYDKTLTYGVLLEKVAVLSQVLIQNGVKQNCCVGLMIPRSFEMIIGMLAIWKVGAIYVPIDINVPDVRKEIILNDCCASALLTTKDQNIPCFIDKVLFAEDVAISLRDEEENKAINGSDIAYIIYTSGSTGVPKGVAVSHESVLNRIEFESSTFPFNSNDVVMQKTTIAFDVSIFELLSWISSGSSLSLLPPDGEKDPVEIVDTIQSHQVSVIHFVPSMFSEFLNYLEGNKDKLYAVQSLRYVVTSGEELLASHIARFYALFDETKEIKLINKYGPTETTIDVSYYVCEREYEGGPVPIGKPMHNMQLHVVDRFNRIAPIGAFGELYISGTCLANGYLNNPELTAQKYVYNDAIPGRRLYKTGDLVRWKPDGNIDYYGRMDRQVKVRGFRIELNEIESYIKFILGIYEVHVLCYAGTEQKNQELAAFYTGTIPVAEIRSELSRIVPGYMIPRYIIQLESMPYRSNGKVDTEKLLQYINNETYYSLQITDAPQNTIEVEILNCWREILGNVNLGMEDDFYEQGGHSILALRITNRINKMYSIRLHVTAVMQNPTARKLAIHVENEMKGSFEISRAEPTGVYPATPAQQRMYIVEIKSNMNGGYNMPQAFIVNGLLDLELLKESFRQVIQRHDILRSSFEIRKGILSQIVHTEGSLEFILNEPICVEEIDQFIQNSIHPFHFRELPLMRVSLVPIIGKGILFFFDMHHIISDGVSLGVLMKELAAFYNGEELPNTSLQFHDYAVWQSGQTSEERINKQRKFWEEVFKSGLQTLELPGDLRMTNSLNNNSGKTVFLKINDKDSLQIHTFIREQGVTLFMFFMSVYHAMLHKITGMEDITVATVATNRPDLSLQHTIGLFINTILIRSQPAQNKQFQDLLREVTEFCMKAFQYSEYPYEYLVDYIRQKNAIYDSIPNSITNTMLIMQNIEIKMPSLDNLNITPYPVRHPVAKYELQLEVFDVDGCIRFSLDYNSNTYSEEFALGLLEQFSLIALFASKEPKTFIGELPFNEIC
ncbi:non-ribosomal peptide synthetase [Paenibacillus aquistagni]|uniref:non-ribosomal peptide synthetase n=1 Tax=Paenibacillus aquistagni TaxID=1852522 RepID=UPI0014831ED7|nr:non-ribosomal peptide synthetase [Paenibacillus aquistagni]